MRGHFQAFVYGCFVQASASQKRVDRDLSAKVFADVGDDRGHFLELLAGGRQIRVVAPGSSAKVTAPARLWYAGSFLPSIDRVIAANRESHLQNLQVGEMRTTGVDIRVR